MRPKRDKMIYFLVNNNYQLLDAQMHAKNFASYGLESILLEVPHKLQNSEPSEEFSSIKTFETPIKSHGWLAAWWRYYEWPRKLNSELNPKAGDTLIFYTEYELLNQLIAIRFKRTGARILLLEDGGVGTYIPFSVKRSEYLTFREVVKALMIRCLPGLINTQFHKVNGEVFPWLADKYLDGLCVYKPLKIARELPVYLIDGPLRISINTTKGRVLFLNEDLYNCYQSHTEYINGLEKIIGALVAGFREVVFKFHPREDISSRKVVKTILEEKFPTVRVIEDDSPVEILLPEIAPEIVASYFSTPLLNLEGTGIEPLFLYHLLPDLMKQKMFVQLHVLLLQWDYSFVTDWEDVRSGFQSGMNKQSNLQCRSLIKIVNAAHGNSLE